MLNILLHDLETKIFMISIQDIGRFSLRERNYRFLDIKPS